MKNQNLPYAFCILLMMLGSCSSNDRSLIEESDVSEADTLILQDQTALLNQLFTPDNLSEQVFTFNPLKDTVIKGREGTELRIYKNTFVDGKGRTVKSPVTLVLKEAFQPVDIVMANLRTTTNGEFLETGGMLYVEASCNNEKLQIAKNKSIGAIVPNRKLEKGMKVFTGEEGADGINWVEPKEMLNAKLARVEEKDTIAEGVPVLVVNDREAKQVFDFIDQVEAPKDAGKREERKNVPAQQNQIRNMGFFENQLMGATNSFQVDPRTNYIFELKALGWANIDRLFSDPRTQDVELITDITNAKDFETIYITMVLKKMYLPGYKMENGSFSFTHGDFEKPRLPVGEGAVIFATGYKNNQPHFGLIKTTLNKKETVKFELKEMSVEGIKNSLSAELD